MKVTPTEHPEVLLVEADVFSDARGFFMETFHAAKYGAAGLPSSFMQDNHSRSVAGVLRGLHYQLQHPQGKLMRVVSGRVFDVAVDIRRGSPRFGQWVGIELSEQNRYQLYVPPGFNAPVLICGFHHSGTRLLAKLLEDAGVFQKVNMPTHEWTYVQWLNTIMLPGWADPTAIEAFNAEAATAIIRPENLALRLAAAGYEGGPWGHKDPRNCITASAWMRVFPRLRIVNIVRSPVDTLGTLPPRYARYSPGDERPQDALEFWIELWTAYLTKTRECMASATHAVEVRFDELCTAPQDQIRRIAAALELPAPASGSDVPIEVGNVGAYQRWVDRGDLTAAKVDRLQAVAQQFDLLK